MRILKDFSLIIIAASLFAAVYPVYADHMISFEERIDITFGAFVMFKAGTCELEQFSILKMDPPNQYHAWHWYGKEAQAWAPMMEAKSIYVVDGVKTGCV